MVDAVQISKKVLERLTTMGYEKKGQVSSGQLIFPSKGDVKRISEQELRQLFIEEFKIKHEDLYFSIETPTVKKYSFTNGLKQIKIGDKANNGQSALLDMCVFEKEKEFYNRILNIEFKHKNATEVNISKDILKLIHEKENGAFILLLKNTNTGTLNNLAETRFGVIDKFITSIKYHLKEKVEWIGGNKKHIELVILSLEEKENGKGQPFILYRTISNCDLETLDNSAVKWKKEILVDGLFKSSDQKTFF